MKYKTPVFPGDGIGPEVIEEGKKVLDAVSELQNFGIEWIEFPYSADYYLKTGELLTEDILKELKRYKAIYLGAFGDPRIKPGILELGIIVTMRFYFDQYVNLRPVRLLKGVESPLRNGKDFDIKIIRENTEDFYIGLGGRAKRGNTKSSFEIKRELFNIKLGIDIVSDTDEVSYQIGLISKRGIERVSRYAFNLARKGKKHLSCVDKANILVEMYGLWREIITEVSKDFSDVKFDFNFVDAMAMWMVKNPQYFDIVLSPNMFGDIITDLGAMLQGGLGLAPGCNINPEKKFPSMFEPIHGSAPKYKGLNKVNPIATIWSGALLLEHIGEEEACKKIIEAIEKNLIERKVRTYDLGGTSKTYEIGDDIVRILRESD
ncbi:MAG: isocitrate/isopropylmalate dehydrogenase family protein [Candidatus Methanofastidiosia archaeon]